MKAILTYHSIDRTGSVISIDPDTFRRHVAWLASGAVRVMPLDRMAEAGDGESAVAITFDDGFRNFGEIALPLLADHALPATVFVVTDAVGGTNRWGGRPEAGIPDLPLMGWDELARAREQGIALGAHTRTHPHLTATGGQQLEDEIAGSHATLVARTGEAPSSFAYPYGDCDERVASATGRHFARACTTELRVLAMDDDPMLLPRLDAYYFRAPGALERWGSARQRCVIAARAMGRRLRRRFSTTRIA